MLSRPLKAVILVFGCPSWGFRSCHGFVFLGATSILNRIC